MRDRYVEEYEQNLDAAYCETCPIRGLVELPDDWTHAVNIEAALKEHRLALRACLRAHQLIECTAPGPDSIQ